MTDLESFILSFSDTVQLRAALMDRDDLGETALHHYAIEGDAASVALLIKAGVDINAQDNHGATPLWSSAMLDENRAVVALLLKNGADPYIKAITGTNVFENLYKLEMHGMMTYIYDILKIRDSQQPEQGQV